jgi:hypothetical protein
VKRGLGQLHGIRRPVAALRGRLHGPSLRRGNGPRAATRRPRADRRLGRPLPCDRLSRARTHNIRSGVTQTAAPATAALSRTAICSAAIQGSSTVCYGSAACDSPGGVMTRRWRVGSSGGLRPYAAPGPLPGGFSWQLWADAGVRVNSCPRCVRRGTRRRFRLRTAGRI